MIRVQIKMFVSAVFTLLVVIGANARAEKPVGPEQQPLICTFSIVACDPINKQWGVAVASRYFSVGTVVPWADADVGAVATQALGNIYYGPKGLELLREGKSAEETIQLLLVNDEVREQRQLGIVDAHGNAATYTGKNCLAWAGGKTGKYYACQGNILTGPDVIEVMAKAFEETEGGLPWRLMKALEAGDAAGGDSRGKQSAAILVVKDGYGPQGLNDRLIDLRVEDHAEPVTELSRILSVRWPLPVKTTEPESPAEPAKAEEK
ncbi:DUF1028 domain-containing protein [Planctomicrobium piriforme]|uniref:Uncharacterized conserved protein, Ntn-hydrolase superfamily n=1 Tax=Planctomicrobium piriforme TaxID=1576369 RepID=A0A1I3BKY0_9PLAN|nr:DUF1028 domain-containing protein [Planctomicrobium piriforme]SFH62947.1 Uncharacterized conserved protein, Ntn-hydrolase superfamily [Planctomicrobium piriforme]